MKHFSRETYKMKVFTSETQKIGEIGEEIACKYLINKGFTVIERNFTRKAGEIDIVARKGNEIQFFEVKSASLDESRRVSRETSNNPVSSDFAKATLDVSRETFRPEENMTFAKMKKLSRVTQIFFTEHRQFRDIDFFWNIILVEMNQITRIAKVRMLEKVNITE